MSYRELLPVPALRPFVDRFWVQTGEGDREAAAGEAQRILPDGCVDVILRVAPGAPGARGEVERGDLVGAMTRAVVVPGGSGEVAAARFRPGGAAALLAIDASALTDRSVPLDELGGSLAALGAGVARRGWERATAAPRRGRGGAPALAVVAELERLLLARLASAEVQRPDPAVAYAVRQLFGAAPPSTIALAEELGWSRQHLRRRMLRAVGLAPKELGRVARLQRAVARLQRRREEPLAQAAAALGYFDQAHMARDFRLIAGISAVAARGEVGSIFPIHSLLAPADCEA